MTGFAFAYAVMRACGGQPRKNPGAPFCFNRINTIFNICPTYIRFSLFLMQIYNVFSSDSKKFPGFFSKLFGQMLEFWPNRGNLLHKLAKRMCNGRFRNRLF